MKNLAVSHTLVFRWINAQCFEFRFSNGKTLLTDPWYHQDEDPLVDKWPPNFTTDDLEYLRHGGRIGKAAAATGTLLKVKPLIGYQDCGLVSDGIAQGRRRSLQRVRELFFRYVERLQLDLRQWRVVTGFGLDEEEYEEFTDQVFRELAQHGQQIPRSQRYQIGVTIGVHTGPTPLGVGILRRTAYTAE